MLTSISISNLYVRVLDQDEAVGFYVGKLGLEVPGTGTSRFMRWLTVMVPKDPGHVILLEKPAPRSMDETSAERPSDPFGNQIRIVQPPAVAG